jgi:Flp pilus assembly protein TadD
MCRLPCEGLVMTRRFYTLGAETKNVNWRLKARFSPVIMRRLSGLSRYMPEALLAGIAIAVYGNTLFFSFAYDDFDFVVDNAAVHSLRNIPHLFTGPVREIYYRPLTFLSFAIEHALVGLKPWLFHADNIALHAAISVLLYRIFRSATPAGAWLAAALFAVTPLHDEVVANVTSRSELLATLFCLLAVAVAGLHTAGAEAQPRRRQTLRAAAAGILFLLALLAKESAVAAPALALVLAAVAAAPAPACRGSRQQPLSGGQREAGGGKQEARGSEPRFLPAASCLLPPASCLRPLAGMAAGLAVYLALRFQALGRLQWPAINMLDNPLMFSDLATRLRTATMVLGQNLALSFVPWPLSADYTFPQTPLIMKWLDARLLLWMGVLAAALGVALASRRSRPNIAGGLAWWLAAMLPLSNLITTIGTIRAERLLYLASAGACLVTGEILGWLEPARRRWAAAAAALLIVVLGAQAAWRNLAWRDQATIIARTAEDAPRSIRAHYQLGDYRMTHGNCAAAMPELQRALAIYPALGRAHFKLARCLEQLGDLEGAERHFREVFNSEPGDRALAQYLTAVCEKQRKWDCVAGTLRGFMAANAEGARDASAWLVLGNALLRAGRSVEAEAAYRRALQLKESSTAHFNLAGALLNRGRLREACEEYEAAERAGMRDEAVYVDWATAEEHVGRRAASRKIARRGLARFPPSLPLRRLASGLPVESR